MLKSYQKSKWPGLYSIMVDFWFEIHVIDYCGLWPVACKVLLVIRVSVLFFNLPNKREWKLNSWRIRNQVNC